jgi:hypothetical protein
MPQRSPRNSEQRAIRARDAGLRRVSVVTKVLVAGSVSATAMFSALAAWAQPGRAKTVPTAGARSQVMPISPPVTAPSVVTAPKPNGTENGDGAQQLSPPATLPATVPATVPDTVPAPDYQYSPPPVVVSGAS